MNSVQKFFVFLFWFALGVFAAQALLGCDYVLPPKKDPAKYAMQCGVHQWGFTFEELEIDPEECVEFEDGPWGLDAGVEWRGVEHYCKCIVVPPFAFEGPRWIFKGVSPKKKDAGVPDGGEEDASI